MRAETMCNSDAGWPRGASAVGASPACAVAVVPVAGECLGHTRARFGAVRISGRDLRFARTGGARRDGSGGARCLISCPAVSSQTKLDSERAVPPRPYRVPYRVPGRRAFRPFAVVPNVVLDSDLRSFGGVWHGLERAALSPGRFARDAGSIA